MADELMKILIVATKVPWPPVDGGRLALARTVSALVEAGHEITVVAPSLVKSKLPPDLNERVRLSAVSSGPRSVAGSVWRSMTRGQPLTIARHDLAAMRKAVVSELARFRPAVVHVEQVQALPAAQAALDQGLPVVLRQQNLEHRLWQFSAASRGTPVATAMKLEARRLARFERHAISMVDATVALTRVDEAFLRAEAGAAARIETVEVPFPAELGTQGKALEGSPAATLLASARWRPNLDLVTTFLDEWWPAVHEARPSALLHLFGVTPSRVPPGVVIHGSPEDSGTAFPPGSVSVIPARHDTGVPMKGLEAWARAVPVVASPEAAASLGAEHDRQLLVAHDPPGLAAALSRLGDDSVLADSLVKGGRQILEQNHAPEVVAGRLVEIYESVIRMKTR